MTVPASLLTADRDRQFDDWAVPITFRQVAQTFDPQTLEVAEEITDTQLTAIVGEAPSQPAAGTAALHLTGELRLHVKAEDLPTTSPAPASRVIYNDTEYEVTAFTRTAAGLIYVLHCRKTTN